MYGLSDGQTFPTSNPKKSEIEFVILFMRVHVQSDDTEINRGGLRMIRFLQKYTVHFCGTYSIDENKNNQIFVPP